MLLFGSANPCIGLMPKRTAYINRLPHEVLAQILLLIPPRSHANHPYPRPTAILQLGHVSRYWRNIAHSTPALWTAFTILWSPHEDKAKKEADLVSACLSYSQSLPLSLGVKSTTGVLEVESTTALMGLVVPHISRCKHIHLDVRTSMYFRDFMSMLPPSSAPLLESIAMRSMPRDDEDGAYNWDFCADSKRLTAFRMSGQIPPDMDSIRTGYIPWAQLQHLEIEGSVNMLDANRLLDRCTSLVSATFHIVRDTFILFDDLSPVFTPTLTSLSITIARWPMFSTFMLPFYDSLTLPNLTHLRVGRTGPHDEQDVLPALKTLIERSKCKITHLALSCSLDGEEELLLSLLQHCAPHLVQFELLDIRWIFIPLRPWKPFEFPGDEFARRLGDMVTSSQLPMLQELKIGLLISEAVALRLARNAAGKKIKTVLTLINPGLYLRFRNWRIRGVKLRSNPPRGWGERLALWIR